MKRNLNKPAFMLLAVLCAAGIVYAICTGLGDSQEIRGQVTNSDSLSSSHAATVVVTPVSLRDFDNRIAVQGNLEAESFAIVGARVDGALETLFVDEGDPVVKGETTLFQSDPLKYEKAVEISKQAYAVAVCARREKEADLERRKAILDKAHVDYQRNKKLYEEASVGTLSAVEMYESQFKQAVASVKHAESLVDLAIEQELQAKAALAIAEKDLRDSLVVAPITGFVSKRYREPGEMALTSEPVLRIDDPSVIEVSAFLPAEYYPRIRPRQTQMFVNVYGTDVGRHPVIYKSPTIEPKLRTFEIRCILANPPDGVAPGAIAEIRVLLEHRTALGVPSEAVQERGGRSVVFVVTQGRAHMAPIKTGLETEGWTEVLGDSLKEGEAVVTMGQYLIEDGMPVRIQGEPAG